MTNQTSHFWLNWLLGALVGTALMGLGFVLLPLQTQSFFDWMMFAGAAPAMSAEAQSYVHFVYGVLGAVLFGWGSMMAMLTHGPLRRGEPMAWRILALPFLGWYVVDTLHSLTTGYWQNAVFNTVFLAAIAPPLIALRPQSTAR